MRTMSACCLTVYAKSPGFAMRETLRVAKEHSPENSGTVCKTGPQPISQPADRISMPLLVAANCFRAVTGSVGVEADLDGFHRLVGFGLPSPMLNRLLRSIDQKRMPAFGAHRLYASVRF